MKKIVGILIIAILLVTSVPALAAEPDGPFVTRTQEVELDSYHNYVEMVKTLKQIEKSSQGEVRLEIIGQSNLGRDIYMASVGHGPNNVAIISQQHGSEPHGTEALLDLIQSLGSSGKPEFAQIRDTLTVHMVPKLNPDGAELWQRMNVDPDAPNPRNYPGWEGIRLNNEKYGMYGYEGRGWDLNRFHFVDWTTSPMYEWFDWPENPGTESAIFAQVMANMEPTPLWFIDLHNQSSNVDPDGTLVTFSMDTAHMTNVWETDLEYPIVQQACRMLVVVWDRAAQYGKSGVTRYAAPSAYRGRSRNQYMQVLDVPGMLIEIRGVGQKSSGKLTMQCYENVLAVLNATVDGSLYTVDWTRVFEIPQGKRYRKPLPVGPDKE